MIGGPYFDLLDYRIIDVPDDLEPNELATARTGQAHVGALLTPVSEDVEEDGPHGVVRLRAQANPLKSKITACTRTSPRSCAPDRGSV